MLNIAADQFLILEGFGSWIEPLEFQVLVIINGCERCN